MIDQRLASVSRNLRAQGHIDNDPDATMVAIRLIALAEALEAQQNHATDATVPPRAQKAHAARRRARPKKRNRAR